jgi:hypothetical protein
MAGSDVQVTFGANIAPLVAGVEQVKSSIDGIGQAARSLAEAFGIGFSISGIESFVSAMAELGEKVDTASTVLGLSAVDVQKYGYLAKASGVDSDTLVQTLARLQQNLQLAQSGLGPTARALQAMGLSAKELAALPIDQQILKLADAFAKYADGGQKAALANELVRNGAQTLLPVLDKGSEGVKALTEAAVSAGTVMTTQMVKALDGVELKGVTLRASLTALGGTLVGYFSTSLDSAADWLTTAASDMTALASAGTLGTFVAKVASEAWERLGRDVSLAATLMKDFFVASPATLANDYAAGMAHIEDADQNYVAELDAMVAHAKVAYGDLLAAQSGSNDNRPAAPSSAAPNAGAEKAVAEQYQSMIKTAQDSYALLKQQYSGDVAAHKITVDQETAALLAALDERWAIEQALFEREKTLYAQGSAQYNAVLKNEQAAYQAYLKEHEQATQAQLKDDTKAWESVLQPIESGFNSQLRALLAGTETWGQAMKKIMGDLVIAFIEGIEKIVVEWIAAQLAMAVGAPASLLANAAKSIQANVGVVYAGEVANMALTLGPAAPAAAAGIAATVEATALGMSALDVGGFVQSSGLAIVHQGETVVPASVNTPYSGGGSGGGGNPIQFHFNGPVIGTQAWINQMMPQFTRALSGFQALNPSAA